MRYEPGQVVCIDDRTPLRDDVRFIVAEAAFELRGAPTFVARATPALVTAVYRRDDSTDNERGTVLCVVPCSTGRASWVISDGRYPAPAGE